ncbi:unnamed protein product [Rhizophagus irregularis]|nr:unnamed protein product [Rhizophagus irregularis]
MEFRRFAEKSISQSLIMCSYAEDLIVFAERCEDDGISGQVRLESLRSLLSDSRSYKVEATLLKRQVESVKNSLGGIANEIFEYNEKITEKRKDLFNSIDMVDKMKDEAKSIAKGGQIVAKLGLITAIASIPFTGGASLVALGLGSLAFVGGTATATVSTAVAGGSAIASGILNYNLESVRKEFSQYLLEMQNGLNDIFNIISYYEFYWESQIVEIEGIIKKLECNEQRIIKPLTRAILAKAKKTLTNSKNYNFNVRQALNRDSI